jgi:hypothetical protein
MKKKHEALMPLVLPLCDKYGKPLPSACRLLFLNEIVVYYSYQHPIAFYSRGKLVRRNDYWERRRPDRDRHVTAVVTDAGRTRYPWNDFIVADAGDDFFVQLQEELDFFSTASSAPKTAKTRRVTL